MYVIRQNLKQDGQDDTVALTWGSWIKETLCFNRESRKEVQRSMCGSL